MATIGSAGDHASLSAFIAAQDDPITGDVTAQYVEAMDDSTACDFDYDDGGYSTTVTVDDDPNYRYSGVSGTGWPSGAAAEGKGARISAVVTVSATDNVTIEHLEITATPDCNRGVVFNHVLIHGTGSFGIDFDGAFTSTVKNSWFYNLSSAAIDARTSATVTIQHCSFANCDRAVYDNSATTHIYNCRAWDTTNDCYQGENTNTDNVSDDASGSSGKTSVSPLLTIASPFAGLEDLHILENKRWPSDCLFGYDGDKTATESGMNVGSGTVTFPTGMSPPGGQTRVYESGSETGADHPNFNSIGPWSEAYINVTFKTTVASLTQYSDYMYVVTATETGTVYPVLWRICYVSSTKLRVYDRSNGTVKTWTITLGDWHQVQVYYNCESGSEELTVKLRTWGGSSWGAFDSPTTSSTAPTTDDEIGRIALSGADAGLLASDKKQISKLVIAPTDPSASYDPEGDNYGSATAYVGSDLSIGADTDGDARTVFHCGADEMSWGGSGDQGLTASTISIVLDAPAASIVGGDATLTASTASVVLDAPAASVALTASPQGLTASTISVVLDAPAASIAAAVSLTVATQSITLDAPAASIAATSSPQGLTASTISIVLDAPAASVAITSGPQSVTASTISLVLGAPAASLSAAKVLTANVTSVVLSAPSASIEASAELNGTAVSVVLEAPAGSVIAGGVTLTASVATVVIGAPAITAAVPQILTANVVSIVISAPSVYSQFLVTHYRAVLEVTDTNPRLHVADRNPELAVPFLGGD